MVNRERVLIGKVYANWCGHCITLKPEWAKMKKALKKMKANLEIVEIEESQKGKLKYYKKRIPQLKADAYPTIFKYKGGSVEYFTGERNAEQIQSWALGNQNYKINGGKKTLKNRSRKNMKGKNKTFRFWF